MSKLLQLRGGTTSEHSSFTGALREVTVDTTKDTLVVHDGATAGGFAMPSSVDKTKLDTIETSATADQTKADIEGLGIAANSITGALPAIDGSALTGVDSLPSQSSQSGKFLTTDGSAASWGTAGGGLQSVQSFVSSGTWTKPTGITKIRVRAVGGGGGGAGVQNYDYAAGGGGAAGYFEKIIDVSSIASVSVTIGAAGSRGTTSGSSGGTGGTTSFGSYGYAYGGGGGTGGSTTMGGNGGTAASGLINVTGGDGMVGMNNNNGQNESVSGGGGSSYFGGGGRTVEKSGDGRNGQAYGSGGGGGSSFHGGGAKNGSYGKAGILIVEEYA